MAAALRRPPPVEGMAAAEVAVDLPVFQPGGYVREQARVATEKPLKLSDVYELDEQPLGEGRYSAVYGATHRRTRARRAIKTAYRRGLTSRIVDIGMECPGMLARHEADILKTLDHPNVVRLFEVYEEEDAVHLALELCEGGDVLERILVSKGRLREPDIAGMFVQMLFAIAHLHCRGVIHRDLKPEHFLFTRREPDREPSPPCIAALKVIDFGLSHAAGAAFVPFGGTPQFMPPEVLRGQNPDKEVADRVDMWALGVVLHAMLVGHYPSPHLTDAKQPEYFAKPAWRSTSKECLDCLGQLLRQSGTSRPGVAQILQHSWVKAAILSLGSPAAGLVRALPGAIKAYYTAPRLRRLALLAAAHELDEFDYFGVRAIFYRLTEAGCSQMTGKGLRALAESGEPEGQVAACLARASAQGPCICASGGGSGMACDWKEFLALSLLAVSLPKVAGQSTSIASDLGLPRLSEDACWRAFDVLALGSTEITPLSLRRLFAYVPPGQLVERVSRAEPPPGVYAPPTVIDDFVQELFPETLSIPRTSFVPLLAGDLKAKVQRGSLFSCFRRPRSEPRQLTTDVHRI